VGCRGSEGKANGKQSALKASLCIEAQTLLCAYLGFGTNGNKMCHLLAPLGAPLSQNLWHCATQTKQQQSTDKQVYLKYNTL